MSEKPEKTSEESQYKRYLLKKNLEVLKNKSGFHTSLISLTIPPTRKIFDVISYLKKEIGESTNIKSKGNRKNVIDSITALIGQLRNFKEVPPNGLIMYSGQIPEDGKAGTEKGELYIIEPPEEVSNFKYYCASQFLLEPLYDMIQEKGSYGIINIENKEAAIGWIRGAHLEISKTMRSGVHGKHSAGGQSQRRLERLIEEGSQQFYKHVAEVANQIFLELDDLEGIYVSGAGMTKEKFVKKDDLDYRLKDKILGFVDVSYSGGAGIRETVIKIQDKLESLRYIKERKIFNRFMGEISKDSDMAVYGEEAVRKALVMGAMDTLILSEALEKNRVTITCEQCNYEEQNTIKPQDIGSFTEQYRVKHCPQCNSTSFQVSKEIDLIEDLGKLAEAQSTHVEVFSTETEEGHMLISTFGGIAGMLRFKLSY